MRVSIDTNDQLILDHVPWVIGSGLVVMVVAFLGLGIGLSTAGTWLPALIFTIGAALPGLLLYVFIARVQAVFDRNSGVFELRRRGFTGYVTKQLDINQIRRAEVEETTSGNAEIIGSKPNQRPVLLMKDGSLQPILRVYTNARGQDNLVTAINIWLRG